MVEGAGRIDIVNVDAEEGGGNRAHMFIIICIGHLIMKIFVDYLFLTKSTITSTAVTAAPTYPNPKMSSTLMSAADLLALIHTVEAAIQQGLRDGTLKAVLKTCKSDLVRAKNKV